MAKTPPTIAELAEQIERQQKQINELRIELNEAKEYMTRAERAAKAEGDFYRAFTGSAEGKAWQTRVRGERPRR
jgi:hypothetical protein